MSNNARVAERRPITPRTYRPGGTLEPRRHAHRRGHRPRSGAAVPRAGLGGQGGSGARAPPEPDGAPARRAGARARPRRQRALAAAAGDRATAASATAAGRRTRFSCMACCRATWPTVEAVDGLISDADLDWRSERQARFASARQRPRCPRADELPGSNPAVMSETIDAGGANLVTRRQTLRRATAPATAPARERRHDPVRGRREPCRHRRGGGAAHRRFELIQYQPPTERVHEVPLLFVPPTINQYYILDIAPGRSLGVLLAQGQQVFMVSWRNPGAAQGHFDLGTYAQAVPRGARRGGRDHREATRSTSTRPARAGSSPLALLGHLAATASWTRSRASRCWCARSTTPAPGTVVGAREPRASRPRRSPSRRARATSTAGARGRLGVAAAERSGLELRRQQLPAGKAPPAFDILYWNQDAVRLAAGLHRDFIRLGLENGFTHPGALEVLGYADRPGRRSTLDGYAVAGLTDHIVPWENAYRSARLLGGAKRFVLSTQRPHPGAGQPAEPGSCRASYRVTDDPAVEPRPGRTPKQDAAAGGPTPTAPGSPARGRTRGPRRRTLGSRQHTAKAKAPGTYVHGA